MALEQFVWTYRCVALEEREPWARHRSPPLQKESTAGGIDQLPCSCICSCLVSLYYKLGVQKVPPRALVPRIRSSRCIYWRAIRIRSNLVSESLTITFVSIEIPPIHHKTISTISCVFLKREEILRSIIYYSYLFLIYIKIYFKKYIFISGN